MEKDEFTLIKEIEKLVTKNNKNFKDIGIGDDCAIIKTLSEKYDILITKDILAENVHFDLDYYSFYDIGYKSAIVNISDIISKGAKLSSMFIGLSIPCYIKYEDIIQFYKGFNKACSKFDASIMGGDTTKSKKYFFISVTALGKIEKNKSILRSGAKDKDNIYVLGRLGESSIGLDILQGKKMGNNKPEIQNIIKKEECIKKHLTPQLFFDKWQEIIKNYTVNSSIDISDGLLQDASHIAKKSNVLIKIYKNSKWNNVNCEFNKNIDKEFLLKNILAGGEDYSILFTSPDNIKEEKNLIKIGFIESIKKNEKPQVLLIDDNNSLIDHNYAGFNHF